ncbi:hypothetical protein KJ758_00335 [Patescibacteria group bacterium]|nr:hypothetical protein [Patescibacteria group bacterium]
MKDGKMATGNPAGLHKDNSSPTEGIALFTARLFTAALIYQQQFPGDEPLPDYKPLRELARFALEARVSHASIVEVLEDFGSVFTVSDLSEIGRQGLLSEAAVECYHKLVDSSGGYKPHRDRFVRFVGSLRSVAGSQESMTDD